MKKHQNEIKKQEDTLMYLEKENKLICPITFMGGDSAKETKDVNTLFLYPYAVAVENEIGLNSCFEYGSAANASDGVKNKIKSIDKMFGRVKFDAIDVFIYMNTKDLITNQLIKYINNVCLCLNNMVNVFTLLNLEDYNGRIQKICYQSSDFIGNQVNSNFDNVDMVILSIPPIVASTMASITELFNTAIVNIVTVALNKNSSGTIGNEMFDMLYRFLFERCYNARPTKYPTVEDMYTFMTAMMREIAIPYLNELQDALVKLYDNGARLYAEHLHNPISDKAFGTKPQDKIYSEFDKTISTAFRDNSIKDVEVDPESDLGIELAEMEKERNRALERENQRSGQYGEE